VSPSPLLTVWLPAGGSNFSARGFSSERGRNDVAAFAGIKLHLDVVRSVRRQPWATEFPEIPRSTAIGRSKPRRRRGTRAGCRSPPAAPSRRSRRNGRGARGIRSCGRSRRQPPPPGRLTGCAGSSSRRPEHPRGRTRPRETERSSATARRLVRRSRTPRGSHRAERMERLGVDVAGRWRR